jgi:hypothetical protein
LTYWQERITRDTPPAIVAEHLLRYRLVAPLIRSSAAWADLGCGNGLAAAGALGGQGAQCTILVDLNALSVQRATAELGAADAIGIAGDLTDPTLLSQVGDRLLARTGDRLVSCFEVVEHLGTFLPLLEWAGALAHQGAATFVMSVPNDAFWAIENPFHTGCWGEGAFEELRRLLPGEQTILRQVALTGSATMSWDYGIEDHELSVRVGGGGTVATHFIAAFGPRHHELSRGALAVSTDQLEQRRWERQRESNLAFAETRLAALDAEREEWRAYIRELEQELGRPLSGTQAARGET